MNDAAATATGDLWAAESGVDDPSGSDVEGANGRWSVGRLRIPSTLTAAGKSIPKYKNRFHY